MMNPRDGSSASQLNRMIFVNHEPYHTDSNHSPFHQHIQILFTVLGGDHPDIYLYIRIEREIDR